MKITINNRTYIVLDEYKYIKCLYPADQSTFYHGDLIKIIEEIGKISNSRKKSKSSNFKKGITQINKHAREKNGVVISNVEIKSLKNHREKERYGKYKVYVKIPYLMCEILQIIIELVEKEPELYQYVSKTLKGKGKLFSNWAYFLTPFHYKAIFEVNTYLKAKKENLEKISRVEFEKFEKLENCLQELKKIDKNYYE